MKKLLLGLVVFLSSFLLAFAQDCSPTLKEIYDYEIGDEYIYESESFSFCGGHEPCVNYRRFGFKILDKIVSGDTFIYVFEGLFPSSSATLESYDARHSPAHKDTIVFIDSSMHILNHCPSDSLIPFNVREEFDSVFTKVVIQDDDSIIYKTVGGSDNLYTYNNDELKRWTEYVFEDKFAKSLGLVYQYFQRYDHAYSFFEMVSHIKGGDTTILKPSGRIERTKNTELTVFPNPVTNKLTITSQDERSSISIGIFTATGKLVQKVKANQNFVEIDFSAYTSGAYFITIQKGKSLTTKKVIKL